MAVLDDYLQGIYKLLKSQDSNGLQKFMRVEPGNLPAVFEQLCQELRKSYANNKAIERKITQHIPLDDDEEGGTSPSFQTLVQIYLQYWRDTDFNDLIDAHSQLTTLTK